MKKALKKSSGKRVVDVATASLLRRKGRPRGKSFERGNSFGVRFVKGISGNPGGRPKYKKISDAARAALALDPKEKVIPRTNAEAMVLSAIAEARRGGIGAFCAIADRVEGKPATSLSIADERSDPIGALLIEMQEIRASGQCPYPRGLPECESTRKENDDEESEEVLEASSEAD